MAEKKKKVLEKTVRAGESACNDEKCALHGSLKVRGNVFTGRVDSAKARKTVTVERVITQFVPKFERYKKVRSRVAAYNPDCISAKENDMVRIGECRKLSKTKAFVVLGIEKRSGVLAQKKDLEAKE